MKSKIRRCARIVFLLISASTAGLLLTTGAAHAQEQSESDLAKAAQNPIANLISLPFQNNTNFNFGPTEKTQNILNIQPVYPITLGENWNLITRTILPVISQPLPDGDRKNGLGDTVFTGFFSPRNSGSLTWGVGPVVLIPTATDDALGSDQWGLGASVVLLTTPGPWVIGSLFSNLWSGTDKSASNDILGDDVQQKINLFTWQYFINYNFSNGTYLTSAPIMTANWEADSGNRWTVPLGGGIGKVAKWGKQPINASIQGYYNVERPEFGADWQLRLQLQFLFPK
ncbi:transporter [Gammaproteobacteria bacterium]|nr:transporter [Gammaproteobacteria bacterium]